MTDPEEENAVQYPDPVDTASSIEAAALREHVAVARRLAQQAQVPQADGSYAVTECQECGSDIGEGRLKHAPNNLICIHCAEARERWAKHR